MPYMLTSRGALVPVPLEPRPQARELQRLAAEDHRPQRQPLASPVASSSCISWRNADGVWFSTVTPSLAQQLVERLRRAAHPVRHHHQPAAVQQRAPQLPDGEVERERVEQRPHVARAEVEPGARSPRTAGSRCACCISTPLGRARRARRVDDVGQVLRPRSRARGLLAAPRRCASHVRVQAHHRGAAPRQTRPTSACCVSSTVTPASSSMNARRSAG